MNIHYLPPPKAGAPLPTSCLESSILFFCDVVFLSIRKKILWINIIFLTTQKHIVLFSCEKKCPENSEAEIKGKSFIFSQFFNPKKKTKQKYLWNILSVYHVLLPGWQLQVWQNKVQGYQKVSFDAKNQFFYKRIPLQINISKFYLICMDFNLKRYQFAKCGIWVKLMGCIGNKTDDQVKNTNKKTSVFIQSLWFSDTFIGCNVHGPEGNVNTLKWVWYIRICLCTIFVRISLTSDSDNVNLNSFFFLPHCFTRLQLVLLLALDYVLLNTTKMERMSYSFNIKLKLKLCFVFFFLVFFVVWSDSSCVECGHTYFN